MSAQPQRARPVATVLDTLRPRLSLDEIDAAVTWLEGAAVDLGYGDVRALPGTVAWIDRLRERGRATALAIATPGARRAVDLAGLADRFDVVVCGERSEATYRELIDRLDVEPARAIVLDVAADGLAAARAAGVAHLVGLARTGAEAEQLRRSGAQTVVADAHELLADLR